MIVIKILFFIIGACIGSFLNVCIYRIPKYKSIIFPPSHCTNCKHRLNILDLLPIISFILLKGKCKYCNSKISIQYPLIEIINSILYVLLIYRFKFLLFNPICCISYTFFSSMLLVIFIIDLKYKIIPNKIVLVGFVFIFILKLLESYYYNSSWYLINAFLGLLIGSIPLFILVLIYKSAMGAGDIKLMAVIGMWLGLKLTYIALIVSIISAGILSVVLVFCKIKTLKSTIPFAPFLTTSAFICLLYQDILIDL